MLSAKNKNYDVKIFEQLPLFIEIEVIKNYKGPYIRNMQELEDYFYFFRKLWNDQSVNWLREQILKPKKFSARRQY